MQKIFSNKKGESLIEVLIAVTILAVVVILMGKILGNAQISAKTSEQRIKAVFLAKDGLEIFRYYRKNNYMKFSDKKRVCWNFLSDNNGTGSGNGLLENNDETCLENTTSTGSANFIFKNNELYIPLQNLGEKKYGRFFISNLGENLENIWDKRDNGQINTDLKKFQLCQNKDIGLIMSCESMGFDDDKKERMDLFRVLKVEYVDSLGELCETSSKCDLNDKKSLNQIKITSSVIWTSGEKTQSVDLTTIFTDYEDRTERKS